MVFLFMLLGSLPCAHLASPYARLAFSYASLAFPYAPLIFFHPPPLPPPPLHPFPHLPTLPFSPLLLPLSPTCIGPDLGRSRQPDRVCHNLLQIRVCIQGKNLAVPWDQFKNSSVFEGLACLFHFFQFFNVLHSNQKPGFA